MKRRSTPFTLIELLVVIGIIAILAGILLPTIGIAIRKAKVAKAKTEMSTLISAISMYQSEYDVMPFAYDGTKESVELDGADYAVLIAFLSQTYDPKDGDADDMRQGNPRKLKFLDVPKSGLFLDPWDKPYRIVYDSNYSGKIDKHDIVGFFKPSQPLTNPVRTIPRPVIIWSEGVDNSSDSTTPGAASNKDNIYTVETNWDPGPTGVASDDRGHVTP